MKVQDAIRHLKAQAGEYHDRDRQPFVASETGDHLGIFLPSTTMATIKFPDPEDVKDAKAIVAILNAACAGEFDKQ